MAQPCNVPFFIHTDSALLIKPLPHEVQVAALCNGAILLFVHLLVCRLKREHKSLIFSKTKQLAILLTNRKS